jgi:hypothetical protein
MLCELDDLNLMYQLNETLCYVLDDLNLMYELDKTLCYVTWMQFATILWCSIVFPVCCSWLFMSVHLSIIYMLLCWVNVSDLITGCSFSTNWICPFVFFPYSHFHFRPAKKCESESWIDVFPAVSVCFQAYSYLVSMGFVEAKSDISLVPVTAPRIKTFTP